MSFKILLLAPDVDPSWPKKIRRAVPGVVVKIFIDPKDAAEDIVDADAAYGTVPPELLARATKLRWICAARAGLGGAWFYDELVKGDVVVTNMRGSYNEHLGRRWRGVISPPSDRCDAHPRNPTRLAGLLARAGGYPPLLSQSFSETQRRQRGCLLISV